MAMAPIFTEGDGILANPNRQYAPPSEPNDNPFVAAQGYRAPAPAEAPEERQTDTYGNYWDGNQWVSPEGNTLGEDGIWYSPDKKLKYVNGAWVPVEQPVPLAGRRPVRTNEPKTAGGMGDIPAQWLDPAQRHERINELRGGGVEDIAKSNFLESPAVDTLDQFETKQEQRVSEPFRTESFPDPQRLGYTEPEFNLLTEARQKAAESPATVQQLKAQAEAAIQKIIQDYQA